MIEDEDEETKITDSNIIKNIIGSKIYNKF